MKRIKVLHVGEAAGGVERYLETLFKYTDHNKIENILICSQNYDDKKIRQLVDRLIVIRMEHQINGKADFNSIRTIRHYIKKIKPDIIYAHSSKAGALARIADLGINNKIIYNPHGWAFNMQQPAGKKEMYKWIEKFLSCFCEKIVCISDAEMKSALREKICKLNKLQVIYNGIDLEAIKKVKIKTRQEFRIPKDAFVIGQVGRLSKQKAPDTFVKAAKIIKQKIPNAYFLLVGDGELRGKIEKMVHEDGLDNSFMITGWVDNPIAYMKIMNVGTLLSRWEGFGLVLPEYMSCSVPVVATKVDAIPNIIQNKKNGSLVLKDKPVEISEAIIKIYENSDYRKSIVNQAKKVVDEKYNARRVNDEIYQLYMEVLSKNEA